MKLQLGSNDRDEIVRLRADLWRLGYSILTIDDGVFDSELDEVVKIFQKDEGLTSDGWVGDVTRAHIDARLDALAGPAAPVVPAVPPKPPVAPPPSEIPIYTGGDDDQIIGILKGLCPHVFEAMKFLGYNEDTHDKELTKLCWPETDDCKYLKTTRGMSNAWCSGFWCGINARVGLPSTRSGGASSWRTFAIRCGYVFGAFLPIRHTNGSNHIAVFLWWIDKARMIAACLGGNQNNTVSIAAYNLSGNDKGHDEVINGPRFFKDRPLPTGPYQPKGWKVGTQLGSSTR